MKNFEKIFNNIFATLEGMLGIHVTLLLVEENVWKVKEKYEEANLINYSAEGISLEKISRLESPKNILIIQEFILSFQTTLKLLLGQDLAYELTKQLEHYRGEKYGQNSNRDRSTR